MSFEGGYVHLYRRLWEHPVFRDLNEASVFAWMVSMACWRSTRVRYKHLTITLDRGQFAISTRDLGAKWGWSEAKARRYLDRLQTDAMIDACSDAGVNVLTICKYNDFQPSTGGGDAPSDAPRDAAPTQERRTTDAQNKEGKEGKEDNRDSPPLAPSPSEPKSAASRGSKIPAGWTPGEKGNAYAAEKGNSPDQIRAMAEHFVNDRTARGVVMKDWNAAWRTWVNNDIKFHGDPQKRQGSLWGNQHLKGQSNASRPSAGGRRSFVDEMRAIDTAVSSSRSEGLAPGGDVAGDGDGAVIDGEFERV